MVQITRDLLRKRSEHNEGELTNLEEIALHQFDIEKIENIELYCKQLRILLLQNNQILKIENLHKLKRLVYLNLALNNITVIENLSGCESLAKLDLTVNFIENVRDVRTLRSNIFLKELYLVGNPCSSRPGFRDYVVGCLPQLKILDSFEIMKSDQIVATQVFNDLEKDFLVQEAIILEEARNNPIVYAPNDETELTEEYFDLI